MFRDLSNFQPSLGNGMKGFRSTKRQVPKFISFPTIASMTTTGLCHFVPNFNIFWGALHKIWSRRQTLADKLRDLVIRGRILFLVIPELVPKIINHLSSRSQSIGNIPIIIYDVKDRRVVFSFKPISNTFGVGFHSEFPMSQFILTIMFKNTIAFSLNRGDFLTQTKHVTMCQSKFFFRVLRSRIS